MSKKKKKKEKGSHSFLKFILLIIFLLFIVFLLCAYVFDIQTKTIIVHGNNVLKDEEIIEKALNNEKSVNYFLASKKEIKENLIENKLIEKIQVKKKIWLELHIYIKERKPLFMREDANKIVLNSKDEINIDEIKNLTIPSLINYVPNDKYSKLIEKLDKIDYKIIKKISDIKYDPTKYDEDRFLLYMNDSNRVYINLPKFKSLDKYNEMVKKFEGKKGILYLDSGNYFKVDK